MIFRDLHSESGTQRVALIEQHSKSGIQRVALRETFREQLSESDTLRATLIGVLEFPDLAFTSKKLFLTR